MPDKKKAIKMLRDKVVGSNAPHKPSVYLSKRASDAPQVSTWGQNIVPPNNFNSGAGAYVAYIDHMPGANFEHHVEYVFLNDQNQEIARVAATTPPDDIDADFDKVDLEK